MTDRTEAEDVCLTLVALLITKDAAHPGNVTIVEQTIPSSVYDRLVRAACLTTPADQDKPNV